MSYDLDCYLNVTGTALPQTVEGAGWQIAVYPPTPVDPEQMPDGLLTAIAGRSALMQLHLEGAVTAQAERALAAMINKLTAWHDALIHDLQSDELISRLGRIPLVTEAPKPRPKPLVMTFLYQSKPEDRDAQRARYLDTLDKVAPKALPRRYGSYEPLPFTFADEGRTHFLADWAANDWFYFWRATAPYQYSYQSVPPVTDKRPKTQASLATGCASLEISPRILGTKKDKADMLRLFAEMSVALDVVYAEIAPQDDHCPTGQWRGLPSRVPLACCLGCIYGDLWPAFQEGAQAAGPGHWVRDNLAEGSVDMLSPPPDLVERQKPDVMNNPLNSAPGLAQVFPFELPERPVHSSRR